MRRCHALAMGLAGILGAMGAQAQEQMRPPLDRARVLAAAREIMAKVRFGTLVTIGLDGHPQARIVDAFPPEDEMTVWVATNPLTRKAAEIQRDGRVTLSYFDAAGTAYVTLVGLAELVTDSVEKAKRWKDAWSGLYRDQNRGEGYLLVRIRPRRLEVVSPAHQLLNDPVTWRPPMIEFPPASRRH